MLKDFVRGWPSFVATMAAVHYTVEFQAVAKTTDGMTLSAFELIESQWMPVLISTVPFEFISSKSGAPPPIAVEFEERLRELGAWEKSSSEDEAESSEDDEAKAAASDARYEEIAARRERNRLEEERRKRRRQMKRLHLEIFGPDDSDMEHYDDV